MITEIIQGASYEWTESSSDYLPSDGWTMKFYLRGIGAGLNLDATTDDEDFVFSISAAQSAVLSVGAYSWQIIAEKSTEKVFFGEGEIKIKLGFASLGESETIDNRSPYKIILDAIDAMLKNKATMDQQRYVIGNRQLDRIPINDLVTLRDKYQKLYNQEIREAKAKKGQSSIFKPFVTRFVRPK